MSAPSMNPIEVVQNLVLDILSPFITRLENVEESLMAMGLAMDTLSVTSTENRERIGTGEAYDRQADGVAAEKGLRQALSDSIKDIDGPVAQSHLSVLESRIEAVLAMHRLDASPAQWQQDPSGKRVAAPDGLWELTCSGCDYTTMWSDGDRDPKRCKTVELLTR